MYDRGRRLRKSGPTGLMMNIAIVGPFGLRPKSTVRRRALPLGQALATRGHRVTVIVPSWDWPGDAGREWWEGGVRIQCPPLGPPAPGLSSAALLARLVRAILDLQPEVVHCFKPKAYAGLVALLLWHARNMGLWQGRLVVDSDDWEGPGGWNDRGGYSWLQCHLFAWQERWGLLHADAVTVASCTLQVMALSLGVPSERLYYLPNGVSPLPAAREQREDVRRRLGLGGHPVLLCYTRFVGCGPAHWAAIVAGVAREVPSAHFLVVGTGLAGEEQEFRERFPLYGLARKVTLVGWVPEEALPGYFAAADLALFPLEDTLVNRTRCPAKLVDLLAAGVPVLAEAVGEVQSYIEDGASGVLLPPESPPEVWGTEAAALLKDTPRRRRLGVAARCEMRRRFSWDRLAESLLLAYSPIQGRAIPSVSKSRTM